MIVVKYLYINYLILLISILACQSEMKISQAISSNSVLNLSPMGSNITNRIMNKELIIFNQLLNGYIPSWKIDKVKNCLFDKEKSDDCTINVLKNLYKKLHLLQVEIPLYNHIHRTFLIGELYFINRRFVEASIKFSSILNSNPRLFQARNMLARSLYFLGNSNKALKELDFILLNQITNLEENIDTLYLIGVIINNSKINISTTLKKGIFVLEKYIKLAKNNLNIINTEHILNSLRNRLRILNRIS